MTKKKTNYHKIQNKFGIYFSITTILVLAISIFIYYVTAISNMRQNIRRRIRDIVSVASIQIDADAHGTLTNPKDEDNETYRNIKKNLQQIRGATSDIYYVYTMRYEEHERIVFVVDAEENPDEIAHLGEVYEEASQFLKDNIDSMYCPIVEEELYTDNWGTWLTGYAPFYNSKGELEGILGVDIQADTIKIYEQKLLWMALIILSIIVPIVFILGWLIGRRIAIPIVNLTKTSIKIAAGNLNLNVPEETNDEIGLLARAFNKMTKQLKEFINSLEQKVKERTQKLQNEITNHQQTEKALRKSEKKYRDLFEKSEDAILIIHNGKFIDCNQAVINMLGFKSKEDLLNTHPSELSPERQPDGKMSFEKANEMMEIALENGSHRFEWYHKKSDAEVFPVEVLLTSISSDEKNHILHTVWRDITERKRAEKEIKTGRERLKMLNKIIRHDISNDFIVIQSAINILKKTSDLKMIDEIEERVKKSLNAIAGYRKYESFINSNTDLEEIEIVKLINELISEFPRIRFNIEGECKVFADDALCSVFTNLIANSVKHGNSTKIDIIITSDNNNCKIVFIDNGSGIPEKIKDKIFDEGFHYGKNGHTGIGLYIVSKTIERFGGSICVEDNKTNGTTFVINLRKSLKISV